MQSTTGIFCKAISKTVSVSAPTKARWPYHFSLWMHQLRQERPNRIRATIRAATSGGRMLAGGEGLPGGPTPAKPPWSEVIVYWNLPLWPKGSCSEETALW